MIVPRFLKQDIGMSLVEVMVAVGVSSGVMLAVSSSMLGTQKSTQKITGQSAWTQQIDVLRMVMNDPVACSAIVSAWSITAPVAAPPPDTNVIQIVNNQTSPVTTYLTTVGSNATANGITTTSIHLKPVPSFTTSQVDSGYSDMVYLEIKGQRILTGTTAAASVATSDLFSGYNGSQPVNPINFTVIRNSSGLIVGCNPARMTCGDLGGTYVGITDAATHAGHGDPACMLTTLKLTADIAPGSPGTGLIRFGDPYQYGTTLSGTVPDSISDNLQTRTMTVSAGSLSFNGTTGVGIGPAGVNLHVYGPTTIDNSLKVNGAQVYTTSCISTDCPNLGTCGCAASYSLVSGGVDCGSNSVIQSYSNGTYWVGACNVGNPLHVRAYCCVNTQ